MTLKKVQELNGDEILARDIMTKDYQVILPVGTAIRKKYVKKLRELGISEVYIKENHVKSNEIVILRSEIEESITATVKDILERHTYRNNKKLAELCGTADDIISTILAEEKIVEKIFDIKERASDIYEHSINVCVLSVLTALKLGVKMNRIHDIGVGCLLHEIGLRYVTVDYDNKDMGTLDKQNQMEYRKHPAYGYFSLKNEEWISELSKNIILCHHERLNGSGFPRHTKDIPFECRIVNVCDTFDEMICGIGCQRVRVHEAIEYLKSFTKVLFDGKIVNVFLSFMAVYPVGSRVMTNEGELAVVISQNEGFQDRPVILVLKDKDGNEVEGEVMKDLVKIRNIFIEKAVG